MLQGRAEFLDQVLAPDALFEALRGELEGDAEGVGALGVGRWAGAEC